MDGVYADNTAQNFWAGGKSAEDRRAGPSSEA